MSEPVTGVVSRTELVRLRGEVRDASGAQPQLDLPPGEDEPVDHIVRINTEYIIMLAQAIIQHNNLPYLFSHHQVLLKKTFNQYFKSIHTKPFEVI